MLNGTKRSQDLHAHSTVSTSAFNPDQSPARQLSDLGQRRIRASASQPFNVAQDGHTSFSRALGKAPKDRAGGTFAEARKVTFKPKQITLKDFVGAADVDYYRLEFSKKAPTSLLNLTLSSREGVSSFGLGLYDSSGNFLQAVGSKLTRTVVSETYYLKVSPALLGGGDYSLKLSADLIPDRAGNTSQDARSIAVKSKPTTIDDFVGRGDRTDYYKFEVKENMSFDLNVAGVRGKLLEGGANLYLRDSTLSVVKHLFSTSGGVSLVNQTLTPGTYYIQMEPFSTTLDSAYRLEVSASPF